LSIVGVSRKNEENNAGGGDYAAACFVFASGFVFVF
jgi:hypothetical protein